LIDIGARFRPFSHKPGAECLIPLSSWSVQAYPTLVRLKGPKKTVELPLDVQGPVREFTLLQDLEKNRIELFGCGKDSSFYFTISHRGKELILEKRRGERLTIPVSEEAMLADHPERLFLGIHKKLEWERVLERGLLAEILPMLYTISQKVPQALNRQYVIQDLESEVLAGYCGILMPQAKDELFLGLDVEEIDPKISPLVRFQNAFRTIRSLFIQEEERIAILPSLPNSFHAGKMTHVRIKPGMLALEWSKHRIKKIEVKATADGSVAFDLPREIKRFRLRRDLRAKGHTLSRNEQIALEKGGRYFLDRFEK
jgi:hypothetical protein